MKTKIVRSKNVEFNYKIYDEEGKDRVVKALRGVDIDVIEGSFVSILGRNGSGKSTFSKLINGLLIPTSGKIIVHDKNTSLDDIWEIRKKTGMVFQNPDNQIVATTVEDDVAFGAENIGVPSLEIRERVDNALKWTGMYEFKEKIPSQLSGGQKQRVAIAGILAMKPSLIVLDEPTAMLDPIGRLDIINQIIRLNKEENITIVLITHFMEEAVKSDNIFVMDNGKVVLEGTPRTVFQNVEQMKKLGLDVPEVTKLAYNLIQNGIDISPDILTIDEMVGALCKFV